jgi:uncharacterized protein (TIGR03435 family)
MALSGVAAISAQRPASPQVAFDVVSIEPNPSGRPGRVNISPSGRIEWTNTTLRALLGLAYMRFPFDPREFVGGPSWINAEGFTVIATADRPFQPRPDGLPSDLIAMLRTLVEDRFQVRVHNEQRQADIYALVLARSDNKTGAGLRSVPDVCAEAMKEITGGKPLQPQRAGSPPCSFGGPPGKLIGTGVTMTMFGNVLSNYVGRMVVDRTELAGSFDIELTFDPASTAKAPPGAPPGSTPTDDTMPSIFTALQEQLGLKLQSTRGPVDVLVIDRAEHPTPD